MLEHEAGENEATRLALQNKIFGPNTADFLAKNITTGMKVLVAGCGTGEELVIISHLVGPEGAVIGIDSNPQQIEQANFTIQQHKLKNTSATVKDLHKAKDIGTDFNFIFTRFVLVHLQNPMLALESLYRSLAPTGKLACEESYFSAAYCQPPLKCFTQHMFLLITLSKKLGINFDIGPELKLLFTKLKLEDISSYATQVVMTDPEDKQIAPLSAEALAETYYAHKLITEEEMKKLLTQLWEEMVLKPHEVGQVAMHHTIGTKPLHPKL